MSLEQIYTLVVDALIFAACGMAWHNRQVIAARWRYYFPVMSSQEAWDDDDEEDETADFQGSERTSNPGSVAFASDGTTRTPAFGSEPAGGFVLSAEEMIAIQKMNHYLLTNAQRGQAPSKSGAILAGFGLKRGGGPRYMRAALIYDTIFGEPEPAIKYPTLAARRKPSIVER